MKCAPTGGSGAGGSGWGRRPHQGGAHQANQCGLVRGLGQRRIRAGLFGLVCDQHRGGFVGEVCGVAGQVCGHRLGLAAGFGGGGGRGWRGENLTLDGF